MFCVSHRSTGNSSLMYREVTDRLVDGNAISINGVMISQAILMVLTLNNNYEFFLECGNFAVVTRPGLPLLISLCFFFELLKLSLCMP
jgi:hypothetical protein